MKAARASSWVVAVMAALVWARPAHAEPGPTVTLLMNTPVSLFTFGIVRLGEHVSQLYSNSANRLLAPPLIGKGAYSSVVFYEWDQNRIVIQLMRTDFKDSGWDDEEECRQVVAMLRGDAFVDSNTGRVYAMLNQSMFAGLFLQAGYSSTSLDEAGKNLDGIIELRFRAGPGPDDFLCSAPLLGTGYSVNK